VVPYAQETTPRSFQAGKPLGIGQTVEVRGVVPLRKDLDDVGGADYLEVDPADPAIPIADINLAPQLDINISR
jgi:hypothetical protein